jgi:hypothetical protein
MMRRHYSTMPKLERDHEQPQQPQQPYENMRRKPSYQLLCGTRIDTNFSKVLVYSCSCPNRRHQVIADMVDSCFQTTVDGGGDDDRHLPLLKIVPC